MQSAAKIKILLGAAVLGAFLLICFTAVYIERLAKKRYPLKVNSEIEHEGFLIFDDKELPYRPKVNSVVVNGILDTFYNMAVNVSTEYIFQYSFQQHVSGCQTVEIQVGSTMAFKDSPILVVVRQQKSVVSWQIPLLLETVSGIQEYSTVSRTLCTEPIEMGSKINHNQHSFFVGVSSSDLSNVTFNLLVHPVDNFSVRLNNNYTVRLSPSEPKLYQFIFPDNINDVLLSLHSDDSTCMSVAIQNLSCPVFPGTDDGSFLNRGIWQSLMNRSGVTINRERFPRGFFFLLIVNPDDYQCTGKRQVAVSSREKTLRFAIHPKVSHSKFIFAVFGVLGIFTVFYVIAFIACCFSCAPNVAREESNQIRVQQHHSRHYSTTLTNQECKLPLTLSNSSVDLTDVDLLPDAFSDKNVVRTKTFLYVADLARKSSSFHGKKTRLYIWNLLVIATFYALPVVQLVVIYQKILNDTGDQDLCYFNFLCSHQLGQLSDFNHVYSNIGYAMLGLLFILATGRRDVMRRKAHESDEAGLERCYGIPQHYGLFYAMGAALMVEGVLSACYHICPNQANYQFDVTFILAISMLSMLKIYQTRHPDINAEAWAAFSVLAFSVLLGVISIFQDGLLFRASFLTIHLGFSLALSAQVYYMGRWNLDFGIFKRIYLVCWNDFHSGPSHWFRPMYFDRMLLLLFGMLTNVGLAVSGIVQHSTDFATHLLSIFITNLLLYKLFYIIMKLRHGERILFQPLLYIVLSTLSWAAALYFFANNSVTWGKRAAESRSYNRDCVILDFYDYHDIWHFLSALGLFFAFMILLTLDDDLVQTPREEIPVF